RSGEPALLLLRRYQVPLGSKTPRVVRPSAFQSPATAVQPGGPEGNGVATAGTAAVCSLGRYEGMVAGSTTPTVVVPSPFQSPTTATQPGAPKVNAPRLGGPALLLLRRYQLAVVGSNIPTVSWGRNLLTVMADWEAVREGEAVSTAVTDWV